MTAEQIAAGLTKAQREALLKMPPPEMMHFERGGLVPIRQWATAGEIGASGNTLMSMNGLGGADPDTLQCGPILCTYDWGEKGKRFWSLTDEGLEVRRILQETPDAQ